jgi:probable rRNA maturation factor
MQIELINDQESIEFDIHFVEKASCYAADRFDPDHNRQLNIIFVSDAGIKKLNTDYRNRAGVTDVLSFSYLKDILESPDRDSLPVIGEIYIAPGVALENSRLQEEGWRLEHEIILLVIHGMLHIYGYDHEQEEERAVMYSIQDSLIHDIRGRDWNQY